MTAAIWKTLFLILICSIPCAGCSDVESLSPKTQYLIEVDLEEITARMEMTERASIDDVVVAIDERAQAIGAENTELSVVNDDRFLIAVPDELGSEVVQSILGIGEDLELRILAPDTYLEEIESSQERRTETLSMEGQAASVEVYLTPKIPGRHVVYASSFGDAISEDAVVEIKLDKAGQQLLARMSREHVGERLAIVLNGEVIAAPVMGEPVLNGSLQIAGRFTMAEAERLAIQIRSGAVGSPFRIIETQRPQ